LDKGIGKELATLTVELPKNGSIKLVIVREAKGVKERRLKRRSPSFWRQRRRRV